MQWCSVMMSSIGVPILSRISIYYRESHRLCALGAVQTLIHGWQFLLPIPPT
ncbi:hypothetical protein BDV23DRAFT_160585 [Aspergillus alliaceus]|uniref:Uncharacterized protein n=1 Tax=Petromyces alliaceus TaxID=209559 RepID=A0A5N7C1H0_PETAA|nr:hypothetical protein BDV23DRAFT_160585 [Aspergillus alliaceus]